MRLLRKRPGDKTVFSFRDEKQRSCIPIAWKRARLFVLYLFLTVQELQLLSGLRLLNARQRSMAKPAKDKGIDKRHLGDKWLDWDSRKVDLVSADTKVSVSIALAGVVAFLFVAALLALWYLVTPRLAEFHPSFPWIYGALTIGLCLFVLAIGASLILTLVTRKNFLLVRGSSRLLLSVVSFLQRLGRKFGIPADRVSNSLLKVNNALILTSTRFSGEEKILLLLPRCLTKEIRKNILEIADSFNLSHATCTGGEDARKKILLEKPDLVVAVACERDLVAGIRDVQGRIPVIGLPNSRPQGPCKCTEIDINQLVRLLVRLGSVRTEQSAIDTATQT